MIKLALLSTIFGYCCLILVLYWVIRLAVRHGFTDFIDKENIKINIYVNDDTEK